MKPASKGFFPSWDELVSLVNAVQDWSMALFRTLVVLALCAAGPALSAPDRVTYLDLARKGWVYTLRSAMLGRDPDSVEVTINGRSHSGAALCIVGEAPHPQTWATLRAFDALMSDVFQKPVPMRFAGDKLASCGTGRTIYVRLYSDRAPHRAFNEDLRRIDGVFDIGLPRSRDQYVLSPAQASTFFGRRGQVTHLLVMQPPEGTTTDLQSRFFASILIEELYQAYTFGMDILHFDREQPFLSKLQEFPVNLRHMPWTSPAFMEGLLRSNPSGLCHFDVFMLHALAHAPVERTNDATFIDYIDARFDALDDLAGGTVRKSDVAGILDPRCGLLD